MKTIRRTFLLMATLSALHSYAQTSDSLTIQQTEALITRLEDKALRQVQTMGSRVRPRQVRIWGQSAGSKRRIYTDRTYYSLGDVTYNLRRYTFLNPDSSAVRRLVVMRKNDAVIWARIHYKDGTRRRWLNRQFMLTGYRNRGQSVYQLTR